MPSFSLNLLSDAVQFINPAMLGLSQIHSCVVKDWHVAYVLLMFLVWGLKWYIGLAPSWLSVIDKKESRGTQVILL